MMKLRCLKSKNQDYQDIKGLEGFPTRCPHNSARILKISTSHGGILLIHLNPDNPVQNLTLPALLRCSHQDTKRLVRPDYVECKHLFFPY